MLLYIGLGIVLVDICESLVSISYLQAATLWISATLTVCYL